MLYYLLNSNWCVQSEASANPQPDPATTSHSYISAYPQQKKGGKRQEVQQPVEGVVNE